MKALSTSVKAWDRPRVYRAAMLAALECVDHVTILDEDTPSSKAEAQRILFRQSKT